MNDILKNDIVRKIVVAFIVLLTLFMLVRTYNEFRRAPYADRDLNAQNTINVSGHGEVFAKPDVATFTFTIREEGASIIAAQQKVTTKEAAVLKFLKEAGLPERDIQTTNYYIYPRYIYRPITTGDVKDDRSLAGYEVSQAMTVKLRDIAQSGKILGGLGSIGVSDVSGLSFTVDKPDTLIAEAREQAIKEAKDKAQALSKQLGVRLVRIVNFNESGTPSLPPFAMYDRAMGGGGGSPSVPTGENKITSEITITYEIR